VIGLSFLLNFLVAVVNLLPIPGFDGWQVYRTKVKNAKYLNLLAALILVALVINALPWIWLG
jgi:Zn-dependent protease